MIKFLAKKYMPSQAITQIMSLRRSLGFFTSNPSAIFHQSNDPDFIVIGAQKSGTSSLHYYLDQHPDIAGSTIKETHYFNDAIYFGIPHRRYRQYFKGKSAFHFESTPAYLYSPETAENIKSYYPNIKLIILLREPGARAYSAWNHYLTLFPNWVNNSSIQNKPTRAGNHLYQFLFEGRQSFPTFRECLDTELDMIKNGVGYEPALLRRGLYLEQIETYLSFFDASQIKIIAFKDFVSNIPATLDSVCNFVGAKPVDWSGLKSEPRNKRAYSEPMSNDDRAFLDAFYEEPNEKLFQQFGRMNW